MMCIGRPSCHPLARQEKNESMTEEEREKKNVSVGTTPFMVTTRISVVAIDNFNYLKKPQLPTLSEPLSIDCAGKSMDPSIG